MSLQNLGRSKIIDVSSLIGSIYLIKSSQKNFGVWGPPPLDTLDPKLLDFGSFGGPSICKGGGSQTPKYFWELFIKSIDPPNKDTSINFTPSQILEGQYVLVSFSSLYYSIRIQRLWPDLKHEKCWIFFHSVNYSRSNEWD